MEVGIIGLPLSGKTTIFNALTGKQAETAGYHSGRCEINTAIIDVPDPRVGNLSAMFNPRKTTWAKIQFNDVSGMAQGQASGQGLDSQILTALSKSDALVQVVRAFQSDMVASPEGGINPRRDLAALRLELILSDLTIVERRIERIQAGFKKARATEKEALEAELALMGRFVELLESEKPISDMDLDDQEAQLIRGFQFLTAKPSLVVINQGEGESMQSDEKALDWSADPSIIGIQGTVEMEISQMPPEDASIFLEEYGIVEPGLNVLVRASYDRLGLMSFFTVGEDEVRAWTVRKGAKAVEAAGAIHSDLARGFIRAEVLSYEDMITCGTTAEARKQGKLRLEGKDYIVQDGDILNIRFNV